MNRERTIPGLAVAVLAGSLALVRADEPIAVRWAYHDDADQIDDRCGEQVPGERFCFLDAETTVIADDEPVRLYALTDRNFAGQREEQVFVRWWNGQEEKWIMGKWVKNITLGPKAIDGTFHGLPGEGEVVVDLWLIEIPPEVTLPGENYYVIQLKGWSDDPRVMYLLRDVPQDGHGALNPLGQYCTPEPEYFGHDWCVTIKE